MPTNADLIVTPMFLFPMLTPCCTRSAFDKRQATRKPCIRKGRASPDKSISRVDRTHSWRWNNTAAGMSDHLHNSVTAHAKFQINLQLNVKHEFCVRVNLGSLLPDFWLKTVSYLNLQRVRWLLLDKIT